MVFGSWFAVIACGWVRLVLLSWLWLGLVIVLVLGLYFGVVCLWFVVFLYRFTFANGFVDGAVCFGLLSSIVLLLVGLNLCPLAAWFVFGCCRGAAMRFGLGCCEFPHSFGV